MLFLCVPSAWLFELAGGAITDHEDTCIPKAQREAKFTIAALHQWEMGIDDPRCVSTAEDVRVFCLCIYFSLANSPRPFIVAPRHNQARSGWGFFSICEYTHR